VEKTKEASMFSAILVGLLGLVTAEPTGLDAARRLWQNGRYAEAQEAYEAIAKGPGELTPAVRASIALGRADCLASQGEPDKAIEDLQKAVDEQPEHPGLRARLADLQLARGDWEGA
jgi:cellulose synthase operon protein C